MTFHYSKWGVNTRRMSVGGLMETAEGSKTCNGVLLTLGEACEKTGWWIHAYCLMTNHFHAVIETPQANLVAGMKWFLYESAEAKAQRITSEELKAKNLNEQDLASRPKGDSFKLALAVRLRSETTVTVDWIAQRLNMGTRTHLAHLLYWRDKATYSEITGPTAAASSNQRGKQRAGSAIPRIHASTRRTAYLAFLLGGTALIIHTTHRQAASAKGQQ